MWGVSMNHSLKKLRKKNYSFLFHEAWGDSDHTGMLPRNLNAMSLGLRPPVHLAREHNVGRIFIVLSRGI